MGTNDQHTVLSDSARRELMAERDRLRAARDQHEAERKKADGFLVHVEALLAMGNGKPQAPAITPIGQIGGLREAIEGVLIKHPQGLKPQDVTRTLETGGYVHAGSTSLALSVSNTMFRMAKSGRAQRSRKTGKYRLLGDGSEAAGE